MEELLNIIILDGDSTLKSEGSKYYKKLPFMSSHNGCSFFCPLKHPKSTSAYSGQNYESIKPIIEKYINGTFPWKSKEHLLNCMAKCVLAVAEIDDTVNNNIQGVVIL